MPPGAVEVRRALLDRAIRMTDLTTLEPTDTPERVRALSARAMRPDLADPACPPVAAVCVFLEHVPMAVEALAGSDVRVATVAGAFPSGRAPLDAKLAEVAAAVRAGAAEIDLVMDRDALLAGRDGQVLDEVRAVREACGGRCLKIILETGQLPLDHVRRASWLALRGGADFVKTSTGKVDPGATMPAVRVILEAVRDFADSTGRHAGIKVAGGIRTADQALRYLAAAKEITGDAWLHPNRFRFGASTLLADLVAQRA